MSLRLILSLRRARDVLGMLTIFPVTRRERFATNIRLNMNLSSSGRLSIASPTASLRSEVASMVLINGWSPGTSTMSCSNSVS